MLMFSTICQDKKGTIIMANEVLTADEEWAARNGVDTESLMSELTEEMTNLNIMEFDCALKRSYVSSIIQKINHLLKKRKET